MADLASSVLTSEGDSPPQVPPTAASCSGSSSERCLFAGLYSLLMVNVNPSFSYHALHYLLKVYGTVLRIRLVYDKDFPSNHCYVAFLSCDEARLALEHVASLPLAGSGFKTELLHLSDISDSDMDYIPNVFDNYLENSVPEVHQIPPPRWFVAYYRNGHGNFIHASRYLAKEIGMISEGNLKKYGKGVLVRAKDVTQGLTKRHRGSAESIDLAQPKQSKVSPGAHDREPFRDRSAMAAPMVSVQPSVTPSVSDQASCDEDGLRMESSDDIVTAVPCGPTAAKNAVQPDPRPPVTGRNGDNSHHSPVGRKAAVHRPSTSQLQVSSRRLIISSQWNCRGLSASWGELRVLQLVDGGFWPLDLRRVFAAPVLVSYPPSS
ncbi:hypothetical protein E2C01_032377 [Portunus trituberculatus]|uniref:RRM domain-containing protein n=1 Tax=Portunus trituberculatus TaxID=210409 RepID=A0A5B7EVV1_PORTR|nr:hypothetical protein [Portunus trituberculatus]